MRLKILLLCLLLTLTSRTIAQTESEVYTIELCDQTVIRNPTTNTTTFTDTSGNELRSYLDLGRPYFSPSPACRYVAAHTREEYGEDQTLRVWDLQTGQEIGNYRYSIFDWSPDSTRLYLENRTGVYLWNFISNDVTTLSETNINRMYPAHLWSEQRGILYFWTTSHNRALLPNVENISAYSWRTGNLIAQYENLAADDSETSALLSEDERFLMVYSVHAYPDYEGITVYNIETGTRWILTANTRDFIARTTQIALSPDGRYLVAANQHIWVWDLTVLAPDDTLHTPIIYYGPEAWVDDIHFTDATMLEVVDNNDWTSYWDITTGEPVSP